MIKTKPNPKIAFVFIILIMAVVAFSVSNSDNNQITGAYVTPLTAFGMEEEMGFTDAQIISSTVDSRKTFTDMQNNNPVDVSYYVVNIGGNQYSVLYGDNQQYYIAEGTNPNADTSFYQLVASRTFNDEEITTATDMGMNAKFSAYDTSHPIVTPVTPIVQPSVVAPVAAAPTAPLTPTKSLTQNDITLQIGGTGYNIPAGTEITTHPDGSVTWESYTFTQSEWSDRTEGPQSHTSAPTAPLTPTKSLTQDYITLQIGGTGYNIPAGTEITTHPDGSVTWESYTFTQSEWSDRTEGPQSHTSAPTAPAGSQASVVNDWKRTFGTSGSTITATGGAGTKTETQQAQEQLNGFNDFLNSQKNPDGTALTAQQRQTTLNSLANSIANTPDATSNELSALLYQQLAKSSTNPAQQATYYNNAANQWGSQNPTQQASAYADAYDSEVQRIENDNTLSRSEKNTQIDNLATQYSNKIGTSTDEKTQQALEAAKNRIANSDYIHTPPAWMDTTYNFLNKINGYLDGYKGASFFYTDDGFIYDQLDENMQNALSGIEGWSSMICKSDVEEDINGNNGYAFSSSTSGASAHIEGEKITVTNYTNPSAPTSTYYYKVSFEVSPGTASVGCNMKFKAYLGRGTTPLVVQNMSTSAYQWSLQGGDSAISYTGTKMIVKNSNNTYTETCLLFDEISPKTGTQGCMIGISEGDYLCKTITIGAEQTYNNFECSWCDSVGSIFGSGGGNTRTTTTTTGPTNTNNGGATVNPNI